MKTTQVDGSSKLTHWHLKTHHKDGTPLYPSDKAIYRYLTACAKWFESTDQGKTFELTQFEADKDKVDCRPCAVWVKQYYKNGGNNQ